MGKSMTPLRLSQPTNQAVIDAMAIICPNCKANNPLSACFQLLGRDNDLAEGGLLCPDCGHFTHSYWTDAELLAKERRLSEVHALYKAKPTPGRWTNYETMRNTYAKDFEKVQERYANHQTRT